MRSPRNTSCLVIAAALIAGTGPLAAASHGRSHKRHAAHERIVASMPPADAVELGSIAPPTRLGTLEQTYGDAAVGRTEIRRREMRAEAAAPVASGAGPFPCDPRVATPGGELCASAPPDHIGYGQFDAFTPAYVSAPTTVGQNPAVQEPIMPAVTSLFYGFDRLVSGARD